MYASIVACMQRGPSTHYLPIQAFSASTFRGRTHGQHYIKAAKRSGDKTKKDHGRLVVEDDLSPLLRILPKEVCENLLEQTQTSQLLEVVLDLGRYPEARFLGNDGLCLRSKEVSMQELEQIQTAIGEFGADNRAGIEGTLHRISAIRSRRGDIIGLTCRVGRAVTGHVDMIRDLLPFGESILFLGRPGVGKTTVMREIARVLADDLHKRVVIVDTSNEIGGDGDIPHPAIGSARRMQVPDPSLQHMVMVEAVENHTPQVVVVDEIGTEEETLACRTIAERGVMLVGTAHGEKLGNLIKNPVLSDMIGGVHAVTLGDDEARARGTQKSVLERKAPPSFPLVVEIRDRNYWVVHRTERSGDILLHGGKPLVEVSWNMNVDGTFCALLLQTSFNFTNSGNREKAKHRSIIYMYFGSQLLEIRRRDESLNVIIERWKAYDDSIGRS